MSAPADMQLVGQILQETGVDQATPAPGLVAYSQALAEGLMGWLEGRAPGLGGLFSRLAGLGPVVAVVVGGLVLVTLMVVVVRAIRARHRRPLLQSLGPLPSARVRVLPERGRDHWRTEVEGRLAAGDVAGGLEALWWWFACSVATVRVEPSWTSGELLLRCRRPDLAPLARGLDLLLYGGERPGVEDLRQFFRRLEEALP